MNTVYETEREENRAEGHMVQITVQTWVPSKYRIVDLETDDIWRFDPEENRFKAALDIEVVRRRDPLVFLLGALYKLGAQPRLEVRPQPDGRYEWVCQDQLNPIDHEHSNTPEEAARSLLEILEARKKDADVAQQAEDEGVFS